MLISEIKNKEVRELAEYYARTMPGYDGGDGKSVLEYAFDWSETKEGEAFWTAIYGGLDLIVPTTVIAEFDMPRLPLGWTYTREYRKSVEGVDYIYCDGKVVLSRGQQMEYPIVVRICDEDNREP